MIWIVLAGTIVLLGVFPLLVPRSVAHDLPDAQELAGAQSRYLTLHGVAVHYKDFPVSARNGNGNTRVFVLIHGFGTSMTSFRHVIPTLRTLGRVIAFDKPGFGLSARPCGAGLAEFNPYLPDAQRDLVLELMDILGARKVVIVAHSSGCSLATEIAYTRPERVEGVVLISPRLQGALALPPALRTLLRLPQLARVGAALARNTYARLVTVPDDHSPPRLLANSWYDPSKADPQIVADATRAMEVRNWDRSLWEMALAHQKSAAASHVRHLRMPVLIVAGDSDRIAPVKNHERLIEELAGARLAVIGRAGHNPHEEQPEETSRALKAFVRERLPDSAQP